jgi:transcriptional regulator with XRE-family HTH domain
MQSPRSLRRPVTLPEVVAAFKEGRATTHEVIEVFYEDRSVYNVIAHTCKKVGLNDAIDDMRQDVCLLLATKLLVQIEDPAAIYGVIKQTTKNKCIDLIRKRKVRPEQSLDAMIEVFSESGDSSGLKELEDQTQGFSPTKLVQLLDQEKAKHMFTERLQDSSRVSRFDTLLCTPRNIDSLSSLDFSANTIARPVPKVHFPTKKHDTDADRLAEIRDTLGVQNEDFASLLGLTEPMLCFYLYNSRRKIPASVMEEAASIMGQMNEERLKAFKYLSKTNVSEVVEKWMKTLGIDPESRSANEDLGAELNLDRSTVWRWRANKHKPRMSLLVRTHLAVYEIKKNKSAGRRKSSDETHDVALADGTAAV